MYVFMYVFYDISDLCINLAQLQLQNACRATFEACGSIGSFGSAVDERTSHINIGVCYTGGSFGSVVDGKQGV